MYSIIDDRTWNCVIDVGGDDRGALALGRLSPSLNKENDYEMFLVVNFYRPLTQNVPDAIAVMKEIETASSMRFTGIINNSNLGQLTQPEDVLATCERAQQLAEVTGLPLIATYCEETLAPRLEGKIENLRPLRLHFRPDWAIWR